VTLKERDIRSKLKDLSLPAAVLMSSGLIEILLKLAQQRYVAPAAYHTFLIALFGSAALTGIVMQLFASDAIKRTKFQKELLAGLILGLPNYGSIYFLVKVLNQPDWEASFIYPINNTGIVVLAGLMAMLFFKERMSKLNWWGLLFALCAIILISLGEYA